MGDDVPLPVLAGTPHMLYDYFKQRFAQVGQPSGGLVALGGSLHAALTVGQFKHRFWLLCARGWLPAPRLPSSHPLRSSSCLPSCPTPPGHQPPH